jgi:hypothetical protein
MAVLPSALASSTIRAIASLRLCDNSLVNSGISPPPMERSPAMQPAPMLRARTVRPKISPWTEVML